MTANGILSKFTSNPNITGAFAEVWIRSLVSSMLPHYRISTRAIIKASDQSKYKKTVPQCDLIIWDPSELPALFEKGDFALVPNLSACAIIEVKRTCNDLEHLKNQLYERQMLLPSYYHTNVLGIVISHKESLFPEDKLSPTWLKDAHFLWSDEPAKVRLLDATTNKPDVNDIFAFIYFLSQIASQRGKSIDYLP